MAPFIINRAANILATGTITKWMAMVLCFILMAEWHMRGSGRMTPFMAREYFIIKIQLRFRESMTLGHLISVITTSVGFPMMAGFRTMKSVDLASFYSVIMKSMLASSGMIWLMEKASSISSMETFLRDSGNKITWYLRICEILKTNLIFNRFFHFEIDFDFY
jgi:hypothetical protein